MYDTPDELLRKILAGEDTRLDLKEVVSKGPQIRFLDGDVATAEIAKDLSCFANTEGGVIVYGFRNDRERVGVPADRMDALMELILNPRRTMLSLRLDICWCSTACCWRIRMGSYGCVSSWKLRKPCMAFTRPKDAGPTGASATNASR